MRILLRKIRANTMGLMGIYAWGEHVSRTTEFSVFAEFVEPRTLYGEQIFSQSLVREAKKEPFFVEKPNDKKRNADSV